MFLCGLGAARLATGGAEIWRVMSNRVLSPASGPAYAPWNEWQQTGKSPFEKLIRAAVLSANPHNSQPWKFRLQDDVVDVYAATSRQIGVVDLFLREMHIGIGCALENLLLAAGHAGYQWSFDQAPLSADSALQPALRGGLTQAAKRAAQPAPCAVQRASLNARNKLYFESRSRPCSAIDFTEV
jgi:hypothetical protein